MKGGGGGGVYSGKRRWRGLVIAVSGLVFLSMLVPLLFLLGLHNGFHSPGREKLTLVLTLVLGSEELKNLTLLKVRKGDGDNGRSNLLWWFSVSEEEAKEMILLEGLAAAMAMRGLLRTKGKGLDLLEAVRRRKARDANVVKLYENSIAGQ
ncbi:hypothetical protein CerSpe_229530 [Prunus speciosa]